MNRRSLAMLTLCRGTLMRVLDTTIVNVALPSIKADLHFDDANLAWVVNAYLLTFGGFLLFGGRLGDWYGQRKLFLIGMVAFTLASLACGLATSQGTLIVARAVQGVGGAVVEAVALSMVMAMYVEPAERAKAMGVYGFVAAGGGALGVVAGGILTQAFSWHWTFLVNVPVGLVVFLMALKYLPKHEVAADKAKLDVAGALTVTASLVLAVYAIVNGNQLGWLSVHTLSLLACSALLFVAFVRIEQRVATPLVPFRLLRGTHLPIAGVMGVLWAAAMFSWFFLGALYLQQVLDYSPLAIGLAFLPANLIMAFEQRRILQIFCSGYFSRKRDQRRNQMPGKHEARDQGKSQTGQHAPPENFDEVFSDVVGSFYFLDEHIFFPLLPVGHIDEVLFFQPLHGMQSAFRKIVLRRNFR